MWKIASAFVVFAAMAMFVIIKGGDGLDMSGEKHGSDTAHLPTAAPSAGPAIDAIASAASAPLVPGAAAAPEPAAAK